MFYPALAGSIVAEVLLASRLMTHGDALVKTNPCLYASLMTGLISGYGLAITWLCRCFYRVVEKSRLGLPVVEAAATPQSHAWEYRSRLQLLGLPFIHLRTGGWQNGKRQKPVKAWIAFTDGVAFGVLFAYGSVAVAPVSIGACAIGLFSYGAMAVGVLGVGGFAFGVWAFGAIAFGWQASAGCAIAWNLASGGQYAIAHQYALGPVAHAAQVNTQFVRQLWQSNLFLQACWKVVPHFLWLMWLWGVPMVLAIIAPGRAKARKIKPVAN